MCHSPHANYRLILRCSQKRPVFHLNLLRHQQRTALLLIEADSMEFHLVRYRRRKPGAADDTHRPPVEEQFGYVLSETNEIVNRRPTHGVLLELPHTAHSQIWCVNRLTNVNARIANCNPMSAQYFPDFQGLPH